MLSYDIKGTEESERTGRSQEWHEPRVSLEKCLMNSESALWPWGAEWDTVGVPETTTERWKATLGAKKSGFYSAPSGG